MKQRGTELLTLAQTAHEPLPKAVYIVTPGENQVFTNKKEGWGVGGITSYAAINMFDKAWDDQNYYIILYEKPYLYI